MNKRYESKLERLEKIKQQIKEEEKRIEQDIGKHALKTFNLSYEDLEEVKSMIDELYLIYEERKKQNSDDEIESNNYNQPSHNLNHMGG
ncbi:hypothetical protein DTX80_17735 [Bacilli bacterium]|nr:hypothetical protein WH51_11470 [Bacilli bacterium VT-13-104]PZD83167.1 hypothetical protein DEJ64_15975 [Bacilli bacterium]PZD84279.1 hypothetical protein DEJ60_14995 [Bacilli bacterium]PZD86300.1 hypothetical protein DEJ66_15685 [Bacilli bacterium]RCO04291.1 hypothetical protein DTX80_17735 [Bacilli bacterium]